MIQNLTLPELPDEILLRILSYLDYSSIIRCGQVSKRLWTISHDKTLFETINLSGKIVPITFLQFIIHHGCKYLSLRSAKIEGNDITLKEICQLKYLDCTNCFAKPKVIEKILSFSKSIQKLSMVSPNTARIMGVADRNWNDIKSNMIKQFSHKLQVLHLKGRVSTVMEFEAEYLTTIHTYFWIT